MNVTSWAGRGAVADPAGLEPFDPNGYRKRVLAAVDRRGGPGTSDAFELYDIPVDAAAAGTLDDAAVVARVDEVWGFWQRQRDHPKYRVLVAELVAGHDARSADLRDPGQRRIAAVAARAMREQRDAARYQLLDAAIGRLVDRHGGVPADKVEGLHDVGALAGLDRAEVSARLNRHRLLPAAGAPSPDVPMVGPERRRQVRALLDEFGRLTGATPPPTLLALLGLGTDAGPEEVAERASGWRARARELPPDRLRVVIDELLVHVADLLEAGPRAIAGYLAGVGADAADTLRPQVRAAVLVEDRLVAEDHAHLVDAGVEAGLDRSSAAALVARLAAELGAEVEPLPGAAPPRRPDRAPPPTGADLRDVRRTLRDGRPRAAAALLGDVRDLDGAPGTQARALSAEIETVLADAARTWLVLGSARAARRWVEAAELADRLRRTASDVPGPDGRTVADADAVAEADGHVAAADRAFAQVPAGPPAARVRALRAVLESCVDHVAAFDALADGAAPVAPAWVSAARDAAGAVLVLWQPNAEDGVAHKVERLTADGAWRVVGRTTDAAIEDGGAPPGVEAPVYRVTTLRDGRSSEPMRSDEAPRTTAPTQEPGPGGPGPSRVRAERAAGGGAHIVWDGDPAARYRVRRRRADGGWSVLGRVQGTSIDDGNVPLGNLPVYEVVLLVDGASPGDVAPGACSDG